MKRSTAHLARLIDTLWTTSMGLFLGVAATTVLAVVETFDSSRKVNASPGLTPYSDPRFAEQGNEVVAGFIGQNLFLVCGSVALVLLGVAVLMRLLYPVLGLLTAHARSGSIIASALRLAALSACVAFMLVGAVNMREMNKTWPAVYEADASQEVLDERRAAFDARHKRSERVVGTAWFAGLLALLVSPWCRRIDRPALQSGDGKEAGDQA